MKKCLFVIFISALLFSCSSPPKRPMKISTVAMVADSRYETANSEIVSGQYDLALLHLNECYNLALSVDDIDLLCRIYLSSISYKIQTNTLDEKTDSESFVLENSVESLLASAKKFASRTERSDYLNAVCTLYEVEIELTRGKTNYLFYEGILSNTENFLKDEPYYLALYNRTLGNVHILAKKYDSSVSEYKKAAEIHTKNRYIYEIGTDWYGVARAYSLLGNKNEAISAIENALKYDKDAENSSAIASDYFACAKILMKGTPTSDDKKKAQSYAEWAASIFKSINLKNEAKLCQEFASKCL